MLRRQRALGGAGWGGEGRGARDKEKAHSRRNRVTALSAASLFRFAACGVELHLKPAKQAALSTSCLINPGFLF